MLGFGFIFHKLETNKLCLVGLHAPSMMKKRVSCNQMEVTAVKQDNFVQNRQR